MSRKRTLTDKIAWTDDLRAIELLDWETRPEDFDRLCEFIIATFAERDGVTRERLFSILPEEEYRRQIRICAERFAERYQSLVTFVYLRMKQLVLPEAARNKRTQRTVTPPPNKIAPHKPPAAVSSSDGVDYPMLDSLPAPASGGGR